MKPVAMAEKFKATNERSRKQFWRKIYNRMVSRYRMGTRLNMTVLNNNHVVSSYNQTGWITYKINNKF